MRDRHVTALFSEAYDGLLDDAARRRFDEHLAGCPECAAEYARLSASVDALRAQPAARMPVPVRLPEAAPVVSHGGLWAGLAERLRGRPPLLGAALGGLAVATAGVAAVVLAAHHSGGGSPSLAQASQEAGGANTAAAPRALGPPALGAGSAKSFSTEFPYSVSVPVPGHPDEVLTLAAQQPTYPAGAQVLILARVQARSTATGPMVAVPPAVPDVRVLANVESPAAATGAPASGGSGDSALRAALLQAPRASPGPTYTDGSPLLTVTLPITLRTGQVVALAALLPDSQGQLQLVGVLTITIS